MTMSKACDRERTGIAVWLPDVRSCRVGGRGAARGWRGAHREDGTQGEEEVEVVLSASHADEQPGRLSRHRGEEAGTGGSARCKATLPVATERTVRLLAREASASVEAMRAETKRVTLRGGRGLAAEAKSHLLSAEVVSWGGAGLIEGSG